MSKPNIQLFRDDEFSKAMIDVSLAVWKVQQANSWRLQDEFSTSIFFGEFLWDENLFDLSRFFSREYWAANYRAILEAMRVAGTFDSYLIVITSALGDVEVTFEVPNPGHLIINLNPGLGYFPWDALTASGELVPLDAMHSGALAPLELADSSAKLGLNETLKLIEHLNVNGIFVETIVS